MREESYTLFGDRLVLTSAMEYITDSRGNFTEARSYYSNYLTGTWKYEYDNKKNLLLAKPEFTLLKTSKNNVVRETYIPNNGPVTTKTYSYTYNAEGYPISCSDGRVFRYQCR
jgi:hypothetical protein